MKPEEFCRWLQGYLDNNTHETLDAEDIQMIKKRLDTVFKKLTPPRGSQIERELFGGERLIC